MPRSSCLSIQMGNFIGNKTFAAPHLGVGQLLLHLGGILVANAEQSSNFTPVATRASYEVLQEATEQQLIHLSLL